MRRNGHRDIHAHGYADPYANAWCPSSIAGTRRARSQCQCHLSGLVKRTTPAYVNQNVVNDMVDQGVMALTNTTTVEAAWRTLLPNYQPGQGIAIKVSFNNWGNLPAIDGLIQPVNAVVRGLKQIGVAERDVWVYDAIRGFPDRFVNGSQYSGVRFFGFGQAGFTSNDPHAYVAFYPPSGVPMPPATRVTDLLVAARYLINMPIIKRHGMAGVSLAFKNHFGSIDKPDRLHDYIASSYGGYLGGKYNVLMDLYRNPHIWSKTVLTVADGLFGAPTRGPRLQPGQRLEAVCPTACFSPPTRWRSIASCATSWRLSSVCPTKATTTCVWPARRDWGSTNAVTLGATATPR